MNPFGMWYVFATPEERREFADSIEQAWKDAQKWVVMPAVVGIVLASALII